MVASDKQVTELASGRVSVTLKGDLSAPWVVVEGTDPQKVTDLLHGVNGSDLLTGAAALAAKFGKLWAERLEEVRPELPGYTQPAPPPNPAQAAPPNPRTVAQSIPAEGDPVKGTPIPTNEHCSDCGSLYVFRTSGVNKFNKPYRLYVCPNNAGREDKQHQAKFVNPPYAG